jgi:hypothetical protein
MLVLSYFVTAFLSILTYAAFTRSITETRAASQFRVNVQSFQLAESAVDRTLMNLRVGNFMGIGDMSLAGGTYQSTVTQLPGVLTFKINAQGHSGLKASEIEVVTSLTSESVFQFALFGYSYADVQGDTIIDSFDSRDGAYDPNHPGGSGDVGTNSTVLGGVTLSGDIVIHGQVAVGPGTDPDDVVMTSGSTYTVTGDPPFTSQSLALPRPSEAVPAGMVCEDEKLAGNQELILAPGVYCFHDLEMTGGSSISGDGMVKVYVTGALTIVGNVDAGMISELGDPDDPTNLTIVQVPHNGSTPSASVSGNAVLRAALYAPYSTVTLDGSSEVYGSIIANRVIGAGNAKIHYDEALSALENPIGLYEPHILSWHQLE